MHADEPDATGAAVLADRFAGDPRVTVTHGVVTDLPDAAVYGSAVMINVLEHIGDHRGALVEIRRRLVPGSRIAIWVPAFEMLYSEFDHKIGHHRRYHRAELERKLVLAGLEPIHLEFMNALGSMAWWLCPSPAGRWGWRWRA